MTPAGIIKQLELKTPEGWSYSQAAAYGHFGRSCFPWEKVDQVENILSACEELFCDDECECEHCQEKKAPAEKTATKKAAAKKKPAAKKTAAKKK